MGCAELVGKPSSEVNVTRTQGGGPCDSMPHHKRFESFLKQQFKIYQNLMAQIPLSCWVVAVMELFIII